MFDSGRNKFGEYLGMSLPTTELQLFDSAAKVDARPVQA
jgi:hypothetical protein